MFLKRRKIASEEGETSSAISKNEYQVFLSFRGPDTRQGFTDCLYHALRDSGISVFRDDDELQLGVKIAEILIAIKNSKICIVVLSPTFAESAWCLREVEKMVDTKKYIVPIFCDVTPDDVKLKTELYTNHLMVLEEKYGKERVQRWRDALKELTTIKGWELKDTGYGKFIKLVVQEILTKLRVKHKYEIKNLVQVPDEVEAALKMLDIKCPRRRILAISGMGGIGKTTLAKIIFDEILDNFDCSCFLENIREYASQGPDALHKLQEQLLKSLNPSMKGSTRIVDPMKMIQTAFQRKKVIIVLDDVDEQSHLDYLVGDFSWFGFGSRIIFTTRNARLHEEANSSNADLYRLEKQEMDSKQALKLFSRHAFGEDFPPKNFKDLSTEAISTTGGLPLALEVIGSLLHGRKVKVWRETIKKLKEAPHHNVERKLRLSYDALEYEQQEMFLDIACFFIGKEKANAIYMWEACEFYPIGGIEALISLSLIKLSEKKCFQMHDQLRDLGRAIVKGTKAGSRLWMHQDALDLLKGNGEKEKVEALSLEGPSDYLSRENFIGLEKLRFLRLIKCTNLHGDFCKLIPKVRWLSILNASTFNLTNLCLRELVVLELSAIRFDDTWPGWAQILISQHLKVLTLLWCPKLVSTPDLSKIVNLERLVLENCEKLNSLHSSVGKLQCLRRLSIIQCGGFRELPEKLYALGSLKQIRLSYWDLFGGIPPPLNLSESINRLVVLTRLELECIFNLPNSIGELVNLKHIRLGRSLDLKVLPNSIGDLRSLVSLIMSDVGITELPTTIGQLAKLEFLSLIACGNLKRLPDSIVNLHSLIALDMGQSYSVVEYPDSFRSLEKLEKLNIGSAFYWIRKLPDLPSGLTWLRITCVEKIQNLSNIINLSELEIHNFGSKAAQPVQIEGIENLLKLKRLSIVCFSVQSLSMEWGALHQLKKLKLQCSSLQFGLCELPLNLESLDLEVKKWVPLSFDLSRLKNIAKLKLCNFIIEAFEGLECLEYLKLKSCILHFSTFPVVKRIRNLCLYNCCSHKTYLADDFNDQVSIIGSDLQIQLSNLKNLSKLELTRFSVPYNGFKAVGVEGLEFLVDLRMNMCTLFECTDNLAQLRNLRSLHLYRCSFPPMACLHIPQLDHLVELTISCCDDLVEIQGIGKLKSLTKLCICIRHCSSFRWIEDFSELKGLAKMEIIGCSKFDRRGGRGSECNASIM